MSDRLTHETLSTQVDTDPDTEMQVPQSSSPVLVTRRLPHQREPVGEMVPDTFRESSVSDRINALLLEGRMRVVYLR